MTHAELIASLRDSNPSSEPASGRVFLEQSA